MALLDEHALDVSAAPSNVTDARHSLEDHKPGHPDEDAIQLGDSAGHGVAVLLHPPTELHRELSQLRLCGWVSQIGPALLQSRQLGRVLGAGNPDAHWGIHNTSVRPHH